MFTMTCAIRFAERAIEKKMEKKYRSIEDARAEAEAMQTVIAYRVFDKTGYRVYSKKIEEKA